MNEQFVRFVILEHDHPVVHWDFMFQSGEDLRSWRLFSEPAFGQWIRAEEIPHHRSAYLDYEGPVSGNRGEVTRWDAGSCLLDSLETNELSLTLEGSRMKASIKLERISPNGSEWRCCFSETAQ